jgi:hypothetical protein
MGKITYERGTTYTITHTYQKNGVDSTDGATLFFTVKSDQYDTSTDDSTAIVKKTVTMSGATNTFTIDPTDVADTVDPGDYYYDMKVKETGGAIYGVDSGTFKLIAQPTNRES